MSRIKVCAKVRQSFKEEIGENLRIESNEISISSSPLRHSSSEPRHGSRQGHGYV